MFKLSPVTFLVCGIVLIVVTWAGFWFLSIQKTKAEITSYEAYLEKLKAITSESSRKQAQERVKQALEMVEEAEQTWKAVAERKTPPSGRIDLTAHRWQTVVNTRQWHAQVERDLRQWILQTGVRIVAAAPQDVVDGARQLANTVYANAGGNQALMDAIYMRDRMYWENRYRAIHNIPHDEIRVPFPTDLANELIQFYFNYPALPFPVVFMPAGRITVEGTYEQIINHVRRWNDIPGYIASVRGLAITGTGTNLRGSYDLLVIAYINTENVFGGSPESPYRIPDISAPQQQGGQQSGTMDRPERGAPAGGSGGGLVGAPGGGGAPGGQGGPTVAAASSAG
jgi:hypothetical protein